MLDIARPSKDVQVNTIYQPLPHCQKIASFSPRTLVPIAWSCILEEWILFWSTEANPWVLCQPNVSERQSNQAKSQETLRSGVLLGQTGLRLKPYFPPISVLRRILFRNWKRRAKFVTQPKRAFSSASRDRCRLRRSKRF